MRCPTAGVRALPRLAQLRSCGEVSGPSELCGTRPPRGHPPSEVQPTGLAICSAVEADGGNACQAAPPARNEFCQVVQSRMAAIGDRVEVAFQIGGVG